MASARTRCRAAGRELLQQCGEFSVDFDDLSRCVQLRGQAIVFLTQIGVLPVTGSAWGRPAGVASAASAPWSRWIRQAERSSGAFFVPTYTFAQLI
jgi:hypothetical protein